MIEGCCVLFVAVIVVTVVCVVAAHCLSLLVVSCLFVPVVCNCLLSAFADAVWCRCLLLFAVGVCC